MLNVAIVGAGPYGLSIAAYLKRRGIEFRIFGKPMDSWLRHMPKGMMLKSDGFASNIYDPGDEFTLSKYCAQQGIEYSDMGVPVRLDTFANYGLAFRDQMVPELEDKLIVNVERIPGGFRLCTEDGEAVLARHVILAVGITHFEYVPEHLATLPSEFLTHSFRHHELEQFRGRTVVVVGGGASALDLAGLLKDVDANVSLITRHEPRFHSTPTGKPRPLWQQIRHPKSGLGPGLRSRFYSDAPSVFYRLPESLRLKVVRTALGPSAGWFCKDKVLGRVPMMVGFTPESAKLEGSRAKLAVRSEDGSSRTVIAEHVIAATGYRVAINRLSFLSKDILSNIKTTGGSPVLKSSFGSSVPGLYFAGVAAANSFGPVMRFAFGAGFAAQTVTKAIARVPSRSFVSVRVPRTATTAE